MNTSTNPLRERAGAIVAAFTARENILARIGQFDAQRDTKLAALDREIREQDGRADGEDAVAIQRLLILREQRRRLADKLAREREALLAGVQREAGAAVAACDIPKLFADGLTLERTKAVVAFLPFFENEGRAGVAAGQTDSVVSLQRWVGILCHEIPHEAIAGRLNKFVSGEKSLWRI
jgi:hypothetical protein